MYRLEILPNGDNSFRHDPSPLELDRQNDQRHVCRYAQRCQYYDNVSTRPKFYTINSVRPCVLEELFVSMLSSNKADDKDARTIESEQRSNAIELRGKDLKDYQSECKL
jgi:hypothetical protein